MADSKEVAYIRRNHSLVVLSLMCRKVGLSRSAYAGKTRDEMARLLVERRLTSATLPAVSDTEVDEHRKTEKRFRVRERVPPVAIDVERKRARERDRTMQMATEEARKRRRHNDDDSDSDSDWSGTSSDTSSSAAESDAVFTGTDEDIDTDDDDVDVDTDDSVDAQAALMKRWRERSDKAPADSDGSGSHTISRATSLSFDALEALERAKTSDVASSGGGAAVMSSSSSSAIAVASSSSSATAVASSSSSATAATATGPGGGVVAAVSSSSSDATATSGSRRDPTQTPLAATAPSSGAPRPSERPVYYYWIGDGGSYTLEQITAHIQCQHILKCVQGNLHTSCGPSISGLTNYRDFGLNAADITKALQQQGQLIRDVSRTNNDTLCPISCDKYKRPHLLSLNGRSYSEAEITKAIASTLKCGNSLRLEDITIEPEQLPTLRLYPNHGLPGWDPIVYTEADLPPHPPFDAVTASRRNIVGMSAAINAMAPQHDVNGMWDTDICKIFREAYLPHRRDAAQVALCDWVHPPLFRDFTLREVAFPRAHPKHPAQFVNVKFERCVIYYYDYVNQMFAGCLFENCTFIVREGGPRTGKWRRCSFTNCDFMFVYKPSDAAAVVRFLSNGGPVSDCHTKRVPEDMITATQMGSANVETLRRRIGIALGRVAPLPSDNMQFKALIGNEWVVAMSPAATE